MKYQAWIMYKPDVCTASFQYSQYDLKVDSQETILNDYEKLCAEQPKGSIVSLYIGGRQFKTSARRVDK
jgi:hypothetical protein